MTLALERTLPALLLSLALAGALVGGVSCGPSPADQVELRLFPCDVDGVQPRSVAVEITGFDTAGEVVETFEVGFDDIAAGVFDDGYATVGYRRDPGVVTATMRVGWFAEPQAGPIDDADAIVVYESLEVPAAGQVLSLNVDSDCSPIAGDGDGDSGDGDGDGDNSGDGDGDNSGDGDGDNSGDGDGDMSGDGDGDMTGDGDGDGDASGDGDGDGDGDGETSGDGDGDGDPIDLPMAGEACQYDFQFYCIPELGGEAGTPLLCQNNVLANSMQFDNVCDCPEEGTNNIPVDACGGFNFPAKCLCTSQPVEACNGADLGCFNGDHIKLCFNGNVVIGECPNCGMMGGYYTCSR